MGTYSFLYIADYALLSTRESVDHVVMTIFRESDKRIYKRIFAEEVPLVEGQNVDEDDVQTVYEYTATVANIKDRLEIMGFSLERTRDEFYEEIKIEIESLQEMIASSPEDENDWKEDIKLLTSTTFEDWIAAFAYIIQHDLPLELNSKEFLAQEPSLVQYILWSNDFESFYHFPCDDIRYLIRAFIEGSPGDKLVSQSITELVEREFYGPDDPVCEFALDELTRDYPINEKIIVLTEGSTDVLS